MVKGNYSSKANARPQYNGATALGSCIKYKPSQSLWVKVKLPTCIFNPHSLTLLLHRSYRNVMSHMLDVITSNLTVWWKNMTASMTDTVVWTCVSPRCMYCKGDIWHWHIHGDPHIHVLVQKNQVTTISCVHAHTETRIKDVAQRLGFKQEGGSLLC